MFFPIEKAEDTDPEVVVIALLARAGHGKTTAANYLKEKYGARIVSLATPLKKIAKVVMEFSDRQLYGTQEEKEAIDPRYGMSCRKFLQRLGTEGIRDNLGQMAFCQALSLQIANDMDARVFGESVVDEGPAVYIVDDARFPNEISFINYLSSEDNHGYTMLGKSIKIVCTDAPPSGNDNHPSEAGIDLVDPSQLSATIVSSRALGVEHLIGELEKAIDADRLLKKVLKRMKPWLGDFAPLSDDFKASHEPPRVGSAMEEEIQPAVSVSSEDEALKTLRKEGGHLCESCSHFLVCAVNLAARTSGTELVVAHCSAFGPEAE